MDNAQLNLEELRKGQHLEIGNFKKLQHSPLITVSYNRILRVWRTSPAQLDRDTSSADLRVK